MKGIIKANTVDKYLGPIRGQIIDIVEQDATVLELGCGNGDLLFKLAHKIKSGVGLDKSSQLITYANRRMSKEKKENLKFKVTDIEEAQLPNLKYDYSIASLFFHVLPRKIAVRVLKDQLRMSKTTIICGFSQPENWKQGAQLWLDQRFTKHYSNFLTYKKEGYLEGLLNTIGSLKYDRLDTFDPVIKIYIIKPQ